MLVKHLRVSNIILVKNTTSIPLIGIRKYSLYDKRHVKPVYRKDDQLALTESKEINELKHFPIMAARHEETCSVFHDIVVEKFINYMMLEGKKSAARSTLEQTFQVIKMTQIEKFNNASTIEAKSRIITDPLRVLKTAIANCRPILKLRSVSRGGSLYQVPIPISDTEATFRAMRWLVLASRDKDHTIRYCDLLAKNLIDACDNRGRVVKQKIDLHKQCEANRAYAHFRWA